MKHTFQQPLLEPVDVAVIDGEVRIKQGVDRISIDREVWDGIMRFVLSTTPGSEEPPAGWPHTHWIKYEWVPQTGFKPVEITPFQPQ